MVLSRSLLHGGQWFHKFSCKRFVITVPSGCRLRINASALPAVKISVVSHWEDFISWAASPDLAVSQLCNEASTDIALDLSSAGSVGTLVVKTPEGIDLSVQANQLHLTTTNKLMGDMDIQCTDGKIGLDKVRGSSISLDVGAAEVRVEKVLEGRASIQCSSLFAKMLNGEAVHVRTTADCHIEAMYCPFADIQTDGSMRIGLMRGFLKGSSGGDMSVEKVDGGTAVTSNGALTLQVNSLLVRHSTAAARKQISCIVSPEITARIHCTSAEGEVVVPTAAFTTEEVGEQQEQGTKGSVRQGLLRGQRPVSRSNQSGKIDLRGAEAAALKATDGSTADEVPELRLLGGAGVSVEALSWMDVIKRKHGFK